jgi:hypothetical protein
MNFRRAILRLWLVLSGIWIGGVLLLTLIIGDSPNGVGMGNLLQSNPAFIMAVALVPPLVVRIILAL